MTTTPGPGEPDHRPSLDKPTVVPGQEPTQLGQPAYGYQPYQPPPPPPQPYGYPPQPYGYAPTPGTNGMAIASLVTSLVWVCGLSSIAAVVTGHIARGQIKRTGEGGAGMALAGLIIGYLGIAAVVAYVVVVFVILVNDPGSLD